MSLRKLVLQGVGWNFLEQLLRRGTSIIVTLLLARFLVPEDFGLVGMMTVFIAIATALMDSGIQQAVIRKLSPDAAYFSTAFFTNLALGLVAYMALFLTAPAIAGFYEEPRLIALIRVAGITVLINSFQVIQVAMLSREMDFKLQMKAGVPSAVISGSIAIALAYLGAGVWALVAQTLISAALITLIFWWVHPWRPEPVFKAGALREMYSFGYKLFLSGLLDTVARNIYVLVIAKVFSTSVAGLYFFAERIKDLVISQIVFSVQKVTYPALSTVQQDDRRLRDGYRNVMRVTTFILFPAMLLLAALAKPTFEAVFPDQWLSAVPYLQLMCIVGVLYPVHSINLNILKVKGRSDLFLGLEIFKKTLLFSVLFLTYSYGVIWILIGRGVQSVISYVPNSYFSKTLIAYGYKEQAYDILPNLFLSTAVSLFAYAGVEWLDRHPILEIILMGSAATALYLVLAKFLKLPAYVVAESIVRERVIKRSS